jgi:hypothetical protein
MRWCCILVALVVATPSVSRAASGPKWAPADLAQFADIVITGRVTDVSAGWDREVNAIYTYVTLTVTEVFKGSVDAEQITIKQLGGAVDGVVLSVVDQPRFSIGEDVLLYLEARPRDGTLYTSALWQGKWTVERGTRGGQQMAVRHAPAMHGAVEDRQPLRDARVSAAMAADSRTEPSQFRYSAQIIAEGTVPQASAGFNLLGPFRYRHAPAVDVQSGGQPGLSGGGFAEVQSSIHRWNSVGAAFRFAPGLNTVPPRCSGQLLGNGRVTVTFMDPCGEMSNTGATLAMGGSYYAPGEGGTSNGQAFDRAVEGFIINNDSPTALMYLTKPGCFEDIQTHELGHVLGLHHSSDPGALMFPTMDSATCWNGATGLRADDVNGILFIYGQGTMTETAPPTVAPTDVRVAIETSQLLVTWTDASAAAGTPATAYQVDFRSGHSDDGPVVASLTHTDSTLTVGIPTGVAGPFNVTVRGINAAGVGPSSARRDFMLGTSPTTCSVPPQAPANISTSLANGYARVEWTPVPGATRYLIQAGSIAGAADIFALTDLGAVTEAGASVSPGFRAWVRVFAANQCGVSAPVDRVIQ